MSIGVIEKQKHAMKALEKAHGYTTPMQVPKISKVVVSIGTGKVKDKRRLEVIQDRLAAITGQKPAPRPAKKSIATFKVREGDIVGYQVTIRGKRMRDFLDRLLTIALPRTRDFRGLDPNAIDEMGNLTIGIKEHTIFPETSDEDVRDVFGFAITVVTTAHGREEAKDYLAHMGFPFKK